MKAADKVLPAARCIIPSVLLAAAVTARACAETAAASADNPEAVLARVEALAAEGKALSSVSLAFDYFQCTGENERADRLASRLRELQQDFSKGNGGEFVQHTVEKNESLAVLAAKYLVTAEFLARVNGVRNPKALPIGAVRKTVRGPFSLKVFLRPRLAVIYLNEARIKEYPIAIGGPGPERATPVGSFEVQEKVRLPRFDHGNEHYNGGDPRNPVGTRWIRLKGAFGLHGTNEPDKIGQAVSEGCIRFRNEDIEEVFDFLVKGSSVTVAEALPDKWTERVEKGVQ